MFIAARKLSAARSYFSLFSSASPSVVFYSESLILSFENNDFLALVFLSIEGFGCFFACGLRSWLSTVVGNRRFSLPGFSSSKLGTLTKEIIHAKRPFALRIFRPQDLQTRSDNSAFLSTDIFNSVSSSHKVFSLQSFLNGGLKSCSEDTYEVFSKFPNFNFKGHLHNLQKSFTDKGFCLLPLLTVFFGVSRSLILDTSHFLNLRHLFTVYVAV
jgi:hypothetical protein